MQQLVEQVIKNIHRNINQINESVTALHRAVVQGDTTMLQYLATQTGQPWSAAANYGGGGKRRRNRNRQQQGNLFGGGFGQPAYGFTPPPAGFGGPQIDPVQLATLTAQAVVQQMLRQQGQNQHTS